MNMSSYSLAWLQAYTEDSLSKLLAQSQQRTLRNGDLLEREEQSFLLLHSGELVLHEACGATTRIGTHDSWFARPLFIAGEGPGHASALQDCELLVLSRASVIEALQSIVDTASTVAAPAPAQRRTLVLATALNASLQNLTTLATRADVAITLQQVQDSSDISFATLADLLGRDPTVVATLMHSANNNLFGGMDPVRTLPQAIARLGLRATRNLALSVSIFNLYKARDPKIRRALHRIWSESVEIAALSQQLAKDIPHLDPDQAMLAGLLHRIGALPLLQLIDQRKLPCSEDDLQFMLLTVESLEGLRLAHHWQQEDAVINAIASHTWKERESTVIDCSDIVHLAALIRSIETKPSSSGEVLSGSRWQHIAKHIQSKHLPVALQTALDKTAVSPQDRATGSSGVAQ